MIKILGRRRKLVKMFFSQMRALVNHQQIVLKVEAEGIRIKQHIMYKVEVGAKVEETTLIEAIVQEEEIFKVEETNKEEEIFGDKEITIKVEDNLNIEVKTEVEDNL